MEIERKFILEKDKIPFKLIDTDKKKIEQTYINFSPVIRVRKIEYNNDIQYILTIKKRVSNSMLVREELEYEISENEYVEKFKLKQGNTIYKERYDIQMKDGYIMSIDIYSKNLNGLVIGEIEFKTENEAVKYILPKWIKKEVTNDERYTNSNLAKFGLPVNKE